MKYLTIINNQQFEIEITGEGDVLLNGKKQEVDFLGLDAALYSIIRDGRSHELAIEEEGGNYELLLDGRMFEGRVLDERALLMLNRKGGLNLDAGEVHSPMPGLIVGVLVEVGQQVQQGQTVIILESMKMQNELKAPRDGIVDSVQVTAGQTVDKGALLAVIHKAE